MSFFEAFEGSRPALDTERILIVRGISSVDIPIAEIEGKLEELKKLLQGTEINVVSDEAGKLINRMDEQIRATVSIKTDTDSNGIMRMTKDLESQNVFVKFKLMILVHTGIFVVIYKDKTDMGPVFIEVVVSDDEQEGRSL